MAKAFDEELTEQGAVALKEVSIDQFVASPGGDATN